MKGFTRLVSRRRGREITEDGKIELLRSNIVERIAFVSAKVDTLGYKMRLNTHKRRGTVIANVAILESSNYFRALAVMRPVFEARQLITSRGGRKADGRL